MLTKQLAAYIDPGTGSMLVTIIIGIAATLIYAVRGLFIRLKTAFAGGREKEAAGDAPAYVIYSDSKRYWNVFGPVCDEFERRGIPLTYYTQSKDDPAFTRDYRHITCKFIGEGSRAFAFLNHLRAGTVLSTTPGLDVYQWKRSKNVERYIHIFHDVTEATGYRMFGMDYYDDILLSGEFQGGYIRKLEELRNLPPKRLAVVGSTYMDAMKARRDAQCAEPVAVAGSAGVTPDNTAATPDNTVTTPDNTAAVPDNTDTTSGNTDTTPGNTAAARTILLAPSWGASSILNRFGARMLAALISTGYDIIVRPHPQMRISAPDLLDGLMKQFPDGPHFSWNFDNDNFDVLSRSDLMITDYSGIMFDYCLIFDRPLMYTETPFDKAPYDAAWIEGPVWHIDILSTLGRGLREEDLDDMKACIDAVIGSDVYREGREKVRATVWQNVGGAAAAVVDYMTAGAGEEADAGSPAPAEAEPSKTVPAEDEPAKPAPAEAEPAKPASAQTVGSGEGARS